MRPNHLVCALATIALAACSGPEQTTAVPATDVLSDGVVSSARIIASVSVDGCFDLSAAGLGPGCVQLDAVRKLGMGTSGQFRMTRPGAPGTVADFSGRVICLTVDAEKNRAWVGAVVTENASSDPGSQTGINEPGDHVWFRLVDYAGATPARPDRTTVLGFEGAAGFTTSQQYCEGRPWPDDDARTWPFLTGDVQIAP